jgi:protein-tyrosine-phosphatase
MAEAFFRREIEFQKRELEFEADSCGIFANDNDLATDNTLKALKHYDIDISKHRAKNISQEIINKAYLILTMTVAHKHEILRYFPEAIEKVCTIYEYSENNSSKNVDDPYGSPLERYLESAAEIRDVISKIWEKLREET